MCTLTLIRRERERERERERLLYYFYVVFNELKCIGGDSEADKWMRKMRKVKGEGKYVFLFSFNVSPLKKLLLVKIFMECVALVMLVCMFFYDTSAPPGP